MDEILVNSDVIELTSCANSLTAKSWGEVSVNDPFYSVNNNKSNSRAHGRSRKFGLKITEILADSLLSTRNGHCQFSILAV